MKFLLGPLKIVATWVLQIVVDKLYRKLMSMWQARQEKEAQEKIEQENLKKIQEAKNEAEKLQAQIDLLNGKR